MEPRTYKAKRKGAVFIAGHHQSVEQRSFFFFLMIFIYHLRESTSGERQGQRGREKQAAR